MTLTMELPLTEGTWPVRWDDPLPIQPLVDYVGADVARDAFCELIAQACDLTVRTVYRWLAAEMIDYCSADQAAVWLGVNPSRIWGDLWTLHA